MTSSHFLHPFTYGNPMALVYFGSTEYTVGTHESRVRVGLAFDHIITWRGRQDFYQQTSHNIFESSNNRLFLLPSRRNVSARVAPFFFLASTWRTAWCN